MISRFPLPALPDWWFTFSLAITWRRDVKMKSVNKKGCTLRLKVCIICVYYIYISTHAVHIYIYVHIYTQLFTYGT